jgi:hypothetical protein
MQPHSGQPADSHVPPPRTPAVSKLHARWNALLKLIPALDAVAVFTFILAIFTGVQVLAFISSERAFVAVTLATANEKLVSSTDPVVLHFVLQNSGKSTAMVSDFNATGLIGPNPLSLTPQYEPEHSSINGPIIAGGAHLGTQRLHAKGSEAPFILSPAQLDPINQNTVKFFIFGFVEYKDSFSLLGWRGIFGTRVTGFCMVYNPSNDPKFGMWEDCDNPKYIYAY